MLGSARGADRAGAASNESMKEATLELDLAPDPSGLAVLRDLVTLPDFESDLAAIEAAAPFRCMMTPGGKPMRVEMTNCGAYGWIADRSGYRYAATDPLGGRAWPAMPGSWRELAVRAAREAGYAFDPDACLINRYGPGVGMGAHRDTDERDREHPIVTVSLGVAATFFYGPKRTDMRRIRVGHGDVMVMGGAGRLDFHGIAPLPKTLPPPGARISLTFRRAF